MWGKGGQLPLACGIGFPFARAWRARRKDGASRHFFRFLSSGFCFLIKKRAPEKGPFYVRTVFLYG